MQQLVKKRKNLQFTADVARQLKLRGWTVTELSRRIGKSRVATSMAINRLVYPLVLSAVCEELNIKNPAA